MGWNPLPRIDHPVPWCNYPDADYADPEDTSGYLKAGEELANWIEDNLQQTNSGHILTFAWNEFEEGAYICPTLNAHGQPDTTKLEAFSKVVAYWKHRR